MTGTTAERSSHIGPPECDLSLPAAGRLQAGGDRRALVMGILNVTPDSFSDGGLYSTAPAAMKHAERMIEEGADIIDVGGESTRPGADPVPPEEQSARVVPVISHLAKRFDVPISIDTTDADVARRALDAGAHIINDVSALRGDERLGPLAAERGTPVVLMHMFGMPKTMQVEPVYTDVVADVKAFLAERVEAAVTWGIQRGQILIDPGFGFGKTLEHNLELLRGLDAFLDLGCPILVGTSRKSMLGRILDVPPPERIYGTAATVAAAVERGAAVVRVHDVQPALHVVKVMAAVHGRAWN